MHAAPHGHGHGLTGIPTAPPQATAGGAHHYVLADAAAAPPRLASAFAERIVLAPHHFQPNSLHADAHAAGLPRDGTRDGALDGEQARAARLPTRAELRFPAAAPLLVMSGNPAKLSTDSAAVTHPNPDPNPDPNPNSSPSPNPSLNPNPHQVAAGALLGTPRAVLLLVSYPMAEHGAEAAQRARLCAELAARGAPLSRVRFVPLVPTASHLRRVGRAHLMHVWVQCTCSAHAVRMPCTCMRCTRTGWPTCTSTPCRTMRTRPPRTARMPPYRTSPSPASRYVHRMCTNMRGMCAACAQHDHVHVHVNSRTACGQHVNSLCHCRR